MTGASGRVGVVQIGTIALALAGFGGPLACRAPGPEQGPEPGLAAASEPTSPITTTRTSSTTPTIPRGFLETEFGGEGLASITETAIVLEQGVPLSGVTWTGAAPRPPYELELEFTKRYGNDFPCAVTFPVANSHLSLVLGGWGGTVCGLSSLEGVDASRNETRFLRAFPRGVRTHVRLVVGQDEVRAEVDGEEVVRLPLTGREVGLREELLPARPLGLSAFATAVEFHAVRWTLLEPSGAARAPEANDHE